MLPQYKIVAGQFTTSNLKAFPTLRCPAEVALTGMQEKQVLAGASHSQYSLWRNLNSKYTNEQKRPSQLPNTPEKDLSVAHGCFRTLTHSGNRIDGGQDTSRLCVRGGPFWGRAAQLSARTVTGSLSPCYFCAPCFWQAAAAPKSCAWKTVAYCASKGRQTWHFTRARADGWQKERQHLQNTCHGAHLGTALEPLLDALSTHRSIAFCLFYF